MAKFSKWLGENGDKKLNEAKYGKITEFDFIKLDKIYTAFKSVETEGDIIKFMKKFSLEKYNKFKDNPSKQFEDNSERLTHKYFQIIRMDDEFLISAMNQNSGHEMNIIITTTGFGK